jgi:hypothetical protein
LKPKNDEATMIRISRRTGLQLMLGALPAALPGAGLAQTWPRLVSLWTFDETSGPSFADSGEAHVPMDIVGTWADLSGASLIEGIDGTSAYTSGSGYATIPADRPEHDLAELTISFYYQRQSAAAKQILLAAGDDSQPGDFSIEVQADGRLRGYHRGQDAKLRFFEGPEGITDADLQVGRAYRIDLTLGPSGARIYLDGKPLRNAFIPDNTNGWNNGRIKFLGVFPDGALSPAHGVFDGLRIWDRQLTEAQIASLERPRSIPLDGAQAERPPANATVWVAPGGTASFPGTQANPMGNIAAAIRGAGPGDVIAVAAGSGAWDYEESGELIRGKNGAATRPIQVVGYGRRRPRIDLSIKAFRNGSPGRPTRRWTMVDGSKGIWQSTDTFSAPTGGVAGFGPDGDGVPPGQRLRLLPYNRQTAFEATNTKLKNDAYCGPGLWFENSRIRIRTQTAMWSSELGHGSFPARKDPNEQDLVLFELEKRPIWTFSDCSHIHVQNIDLLYANECVRLDNSKNMTFERCQFEGEEDYFSLRPGSDNCKILRSKFHYNVPNYMSWRDFKQSNTPIADMNGRGGIKSTSGDVSNLLVQNCEFFGCLIPIWAGGAGCTGWKILNNEFRRCRDDCVDYDVRTANMEIAYNWVHDRSQWFIGFSGPAGTSPSPQSSIYVHHNLVDISTPYLYQRTGTGEANTAPAPGTAMSGERLWLGHLGGNPPAGVLLRVYHNTFVVNWSDPVDRKGVGITPNRGWPAPAAGISHDVFNNIFVQCGQRPLEGFFAVYKQNKIDGNCWHRAVRSSQPFFSEVFRSDGDNSDYADLAAAKDDREMIKASETFYAPGFEASGIQANPQFAGGSPQGAHEFSSRAAYVPRNGQVTAGAVKLVGKGFPGPQDSSYQAWRGALDPSGDGSEVGVR